MLLIQNIESVLMYMNIFVDICCMQGHDASQYNIYTNQISCKAVNTITASVHI